MIQRNDQRPRPPLALWGGVECSVIRVGDDYYDQIDRSGHAIRPEDLDAVADLGVRALRYPVLWERTAPEGVERADWSWPDERLQRIRTLGIRPLVGLVHHGSGPRTTSLVEPSFAEGLAAFAGAVAARYPWVEDYTPVNEPLTTARFSGLYGHWYPHGRDAKSFALALLNQCRGVVLSMRAIRHINSAARLVQTDDLGKTYSTPSLSYQADFENERRWLSFDLLCGRVDRRHPMWRYLIKAGVGERNLSWFLDNPSPPDILGINHYLTSERFLDDRLEHYPVEWCAGNNRDAYADVEAVRVCRAGPAGPQVLLRETWDRYGLPVAVTEAHLGCTREEQMRWFLQVWNAAEGARVDGVDVRAVTAWSLLGAYDWDSLVTKPRGHYEPGAFDLRSPRPRPTALAKMLRELASGAQASHSVADAPGWWQRPERLLYPAAPCDSTEPARTSDSRRRSERSKVIVIAGATGILARAFAELCTLRGLPHRLLSNLEMDVTDESSVDKALNGLKPWAVVNAADYGRVDAAEWDPSACRRANADGPAILAAACSRRNLSLVCFSSDHVFGGDRNAPYLEGDAVDPRNVYGQSKVEMEHRVRESLPSALIVRTGALFGPWDERNFVTVGLRRLAAGRSYVAADDVVVSPTYVPDLVHAALDLLVDGESGLWHLTNADSISWAELARRAAVHAGLEPSKVKGRPATALRMIAPRPAFSALASERGALLPSLDDALLRYIRECEVAWSPAAASVLGPEVSSSAKSAVLSRKWSARRVRRVDLPASGIDV